MIGNKGKTTFLYEYINPNNENLYNIKYEINNDEETWEQMIQHYINFLRSVGYNIPDSEDRV